MQLFEKDYKAAAKTELERDIRELEARDKTAQTTMDASDISANITFAQRINLIDEKQAQNLRRRIDEAKKFEQLMRNECGERVDDFENPRERAERFFDMESVNAHISEARAMDTVDHRNHSDKCRSYGEKEK